jgi:anti-sigma B factor antagonist
MVSLERHSQTRATLICSGEIDQSTIGELRDGFADATTPELRSLLVDMREVTFLDSTGLGTLVAAALQCERMGAEFRLEGSPAVERLLNAAGLRDFVHGRIELPRREDRESA